MQPDTPSDDDVTVTFHRVYPAAIPPMRADKSAMGIMPTMAFRHCEPMRMASSFGWYIFPPEDIFLKWNGADVFFKQDDEWVPLSKAYLPGFAEYWDANAPEEMQGLAPPFLSCLPVRGIVQIWSGLLCGTRPGWSVLVRPVANVRGSHLYSCSEGLVESDSFHPFPLFTNIQLIATDVPIEIPKGVPLFQIQPLMRGTYGDAAHRYEDREGMGLLANGEPAMSEADWAGYRKTIRVEVDDAPAESGQYTAATRKRTKHED
ncbi:hypothetical protein [Rhodoferax sp.]|uniref:hypothetical protein n=1 Tax=Rhodoferax sp. TaxID=50421 RepID=UPI001EC8F6C2|nr:hypothetical protein [Rhodoferax sp.]MBT9505743.1 hypothetical protein [Rhodoferax sp.]